jgi:hypothetical protein
MLNQADVGCNGESGDNANTHTANSQTEQLEGDARISADTATKPTETSDHLQNSQNDKVDTFSISDRPRVMPVSGVVLPPVTWRHPNAVLQSNFTSFKYIQSREHGPRCSPMSDSDQIKREVSVVVIPGHGNIHVEDSSQARQCNVEMPTSLVAMSGGGHLDNGTVTRLSSMLNHPLDGNSS